ncbi:branched-chain amino acid transport system II carrier protein [Alloscardovia venturai]|uniref:Branched-chain amino acid transport system II carrier protein n=1 Tax=Alloscardovia venturai TaxID=1769421 RepID=A0ABW2Y698_9BIFI
MIKKLNFKQTITVASMLFGLFFGAGNLIFPVSMGQNAGSQSWAAAIGFCVTGVGLPLLGIAALAISRSSGLFDLSSLVSKGYAYFFTVALYLTIGPLFAIPRTATVSFQVGVAPLLPGENQQVALGIFSILFFAVVLFFSLKPHGILDWIGKILNPIFLTFLAILVIVALIHPMGDMSVVKPSSEYAAHTFFAGFLEGYNTMDVLASLAFGVILVDVVRGLGVKEPQDTALSAIKSGLYSSAMMVGIYVVLTIIGSQSVDVIGVSSDGGTALFKIAQHYFGTFGGVLLGIIITVACAKTAIGLITSLSTTFTSLFPRVMTYNRWAILFTIISASIANAGLNAIITVSVPALSFLYPLAIALIILALCGKLFHYRTSVFVWGIGLTTASATLTLLVSIVGLFKAQVPAVYNAVSALNRLQPLSQYGMGWIVPLIVGVIIGASLRTKSSQKKEK